MIASVPPQDKLWFVKENDAKVIDVTSFPYTWVGCGITTTPTNPSIVGPCKAGQTRIEANVYTFHRDLADGKIKKGQTVMYDQEGWSATPAYVRAHPLWGLWYAGKLARDYGVRLIEAPVGNARTGQQQQLQVAASQDAPVVELQNQYLDRNPSAYIASVKKADSAIQKDRPGTVVLAGLAPDAGGIPVPASNMVAEYNGTTSVVQGYWLNADKWAGHPGCAPAGCPATVQQFIREISLCRLTTGRIAHGVLCVLRRITRTH